MKIDGVIYLDHQATCPLDSTVFAEMMPYFEGRFGNPHSSDHAVGWRASQAVQRAASEIATLIGADPDEIIFTSGATEANNLALLGLAREGLASKRRRILLSSIEHKCVLEIGRALSVEYGFSIEHLPVDSQGALDLDALENSIADDVFLVSVMGANNEIGTIQDIERISRIVGASGAYFHCDAAQAPSAMDVSRLADHADLVSLSSHKMYGPSGIGALFARRDLQPLMQPTILGGGQQNGLRSGTLPAALCVGFGAAASIAASEGGDHRRKQLADLRDSFLKQLQNLPCSIWVTGPLDSERKHPGNLNVGFEGVSAADLLSRLQPKIAASTGSACTSGITEPSHVLSAIGLDDERASSSLRFSLGKDTTLDDVSEATDLIKEAVLDLIGSGLLEVV